MMISRDELRSLTTDYRGSCVSIYMPTRVAGAQTRQNSTRLKNLVRAAEDELTQLGMRSAQAREYLQTAYRLQGTREFWSNQDQAFALLMSDDNAVDYQLPFSTRSVAIVSDRFHIKPLMPLNAGNGVFHVLAVSQNEVRLLECTRYTVEQVDVDDLPSNLAEVLRYDDPERQLQFHSGGSSGRGQRTSVFYGQGASEADERENLLRFFRAIDEGLRTYVQGDTVPLVVAGVDFLHPLYREASTYRTLMNEGIKGSPERLSDAELRDRAWKVVEPVFKQDREEASARLRQLLGTGRASNQLQAVLRAAYLGRIETLFVATDTEKWGHYSLDGDQLDLHSERQPGDPDLLNLAVIQTVLHDGAVYPVQSTANDNSGEDTTGWPIAAVFRY